MKKPLFQQVLIIGVGMIGASLGRGLIKNKLAKNICGVDSLQRSVKQAKAVGAIHDGGVRLDPAILKRCDLIVLAVPVRSIPLILKKIASYIRPDCLVIDVGSTKSGVIKTAEKVFLQGNFIGCHPMAGSEKSGALAADSGLFKGKKCYIIPPQNARHKMLQKANILWKRLGAKVLRTNVTRHDRDVGYMSHLPHAVAFALAKTLSEIKTGIGSAGGGVRDTTRIAASSAEMWNDIFLENATTLIQSLKKFRNEITIFMNAVENKNSMALRRYMERAARWRRRLNIYE